MQSKTHTPLLAVFAVLTALVLAVAPAALLGSPARAPEVRVAVERRVWWCSPRPMVTTCRISVGR